MVVYSIIKRYRRLCTEEMENFYCKFRVIWELYTRIGKIDYLFGFSNRKRGFIQLYTMVVIILIEIEGFVDFWC